MPHGGGVLFSPLKGIRDKTNQAAAAGAGRFYKTNPSGSILGSPEKHPSSHAPQFYDKLLCVPLLNLSVRALDRFSESFALRFHPLNLMARWGPRNLSFALMAIWALLFGAMTMTGFVGHSHPGQSIAFWKDACKQSRYRACVTWVHALQTDCRSNDASACLTRAAKLWRGRPIWVCVPAAWN